MSVPTSTDDLLTYTQAAEVTGYTPNYISHLASDGTLHPYKVPGIRSKFLRSDEVQWLLRRKNGAAENNPFDVAQSTSPIFDTDDEETLRESDSGLASALGLANILLLPLMQQKPPNPEQLERLRRAPELLPLRQAILKLAGEVTR